MHTTCIYGLIFPESNAKFLILQRKNNIGLFNEALMEFGYATCNYDIINIYEKEDKTILALKYEQWWVTFCVLKALVKYAYLRISTHASGACLRP